MTELLTKIKTAIELIKNEERSIHDNGINLINNLEDVSNTPITRTESELRKDLENYEDQRIKILNVGIELKQVLNGLIDQALLEYSENMIRKEKITYEQMIILYKKDYDY